MDEYDVRVFWDRIALDSPDDHLDSSLAEPLDEPATRSVIGHEIGHGLGISHPSSQPLSIMHQAWEAWGLEWQTIQHEYLNRDTLQIRTGPR